MLVWLFVIAAFLVYLEAYGLSAVRLLDSLAAPVGGWAFSPEGELASWLNGMQKDDVFVVDNGGGILKSGWASAPQATVVFPNCQCRVKGDQPFLGNEL